MNADLIIYGVIETKNGNYVISPEFYVNSRNLFPSEELIGQHILGSQINVPFSGNSTPTTINLNRELSRRSQIMAYVAKGLGLYLTHYYEGALAFFQKANDDNLWQFNSGREVIYLFVGNCAGKTGDLLLAENSFNKALEIEKDYARAYIGLGGVYYSYSLKKFTENNIPPNNDEMARALELFEKATSIEGQPETADILEKAAFGKGQIFLAQWLAGQPSHSDSSEGEELLVEAINQFDIVVTQFDNGKNPRLQELASEANARLGLIHLQTEELDLAINYYILAGN